LQDAPANGPTRFMLLNGGRVYMTGIGMFTPRDSPLRNFAMLQNAAAVGMRDFYGISGNIAGPLSGN